MLKLLIPLWILALFLIAPSGICNAETAEGETEMIRDKAREEAVVQWISAKVNPEMGKAVAEALESVEQHPYHHLERSLRTDICRRMINYDQGFYENRPRYSSRVFLAEKQLALVRPLWNRTWRDDSTVADLIDTFNRIAKAETLEDKAELLAGWEQKWEKVRTWTQQTWLKDTNHQFHHFPEAMVSLSAAAALIVAGEGAIQPEQASHMFEKDTPNQFWYEDMDFYAASAYAGGVPYLAKNLIDPQKFYGGLPYLSFDQGDPQKYRKYWRWWLLEALPESLANYHKGYIGMEEDWKQKP